MNETALLRASPAAPLLEEAMAPLLGWLREPSTEDIAVQLPGEAWIFTRKGGWRREDVDLDLDRMEDIAILAGALRKQDIGELHPLLDTMITDGSRLHSCLPPTVPHGFLSLTIRKHEREIAAPDAIYERYRTGNWNKRGKVEAPQRGADLLPLYDGDKLVNFLKGAVRGRFNVLICGATGSGKTTLANTLCTAIGENERIVTIEDTEEFQFLQRNYVRLLYSKGNLQGYAEGIDPLIDAAKRMRPGRILIHELRDDAAVTYLKNSSSGHRGSITTIHAETAGDCVRRLMTLVSLSHTGSALSEGAMLNLLTPAIDIIVPLTRVNKEADFQFGQVWFVADAARKNEKLSDLLNAA